MTKQMLMSARRDEKELVFYGELRANLGELAKTICGTVTD